MPNIPPELMNVMQGGQPPAGAPQATQAPTSSPMSTPQPNEGEKGGAMAQVQMAMHVLEQTLVPFGSSSPEGEAILKVLQTLGKQFGETKDKGRSLIPSEIMNLVAGMPKGSAPQPPGAGAPPGAAPGGQQPPMM